ncbi:hypothetical protein [Streptomyces olivaceoviridis]
MQDIAGWIDYLPCCDVFRLREGKIESFNRYPSGTVLFGQLGVLSRGAV